jgi:aspartyl-tRNA(Asn)/glutamyl-tRNA(Gln) amidotransferase subunit C
MAKKRKKLTKNQVRHVARLAGLTLSKKEVAKFQQELSDILDYVAQLNEIDTLKVEPTSQVTGLENIFRKDKSAPSLSQKEVLSGAKTKLNNYFKIKGIFDET